MTTSETDNDAEWRAQLWRKMAGHEKAKDILMRRHDIDDRSAASLLALCAEQRRVEVAEIARLLGR
ncbi:hypothetical protein BS329_17020 [Amycolatopsis coloradensis]|uniref:ANTAR domain-containing protein n=1 Tax=Amycolatopsis coloradensis TaxID=76021 RepID=A0A1R0KTV8_9PSEU|nr:ANTAR domain-containing protein [Amycolatopsis coloradensis]OLZ51481.1 hypothetical protein BS329_17020 [Amycolatopsis coloradensis]